MILSLGFYLVYEHQQHQFDLLLESSALDWEWKASPAAMEEIAGRDTYIDLVVQRGGTFIDAAFGDEVANPPNQSRDVPSAGIGSLADWLIEDQQRNMENTLAYR